MLFDKAAAVCCAYKAAENGAYAPLRGTACIDYRNLQKIGLPKRKTEQRSFQNMKATGIVRRIDYRVIIGTKVRSLENTGFSLIFVQFHQYPKP